MIEIDTNVLVRHLVQDDPRQPRAATQSSRRNVRGSPPGLSTALSRSANSFRFWRAPMDIRKKPL